MFIIESYLLELIFDIMCIILNNIIFSFVTYIVGEKIPKSNSISKIIFGFYSGFQYIKSMKSVLKYVC